MNISAITMTTLRLVMATLGLVYIPENSPVNTVVSANTALDDDTGDNGDVRYRLVRDPANYFTIDEDTGVLRTNKVSSSTRSTFLP